MTEIPRQSPLQFIDEKRGGDSSYVMNRRISPELNTVLHSQLDSFVKVSVQETRWFNNQTDEGDEFIYSKKIIFGTLKSVTGDHIEVDVVSGEVDFGNEKRSPLATGVLSVPFRHEQFDFRRFREIVEIQELSVEGRNLIQNPTVVNNENCA